jgi:hypothetical protein
MSDWLTLFASAYRKAFEELKEAHPGMILLGRFPHGCCSFAAEMMCDHLKELGRDVKCFGGGELENDGSHIWVVCDGVVVDITADQFGDALPSVYVGGGLNLHKQYKNKKMEVRLDVYDVGLINMVRSKAEEHLEAIGFNSSC